MRSVTTAHRAAAPTAARRLAAARLLAAALIAAAAIPAGTAAAARADGLPAVLIDRPGGLLGRAERVRVSATIRFGYTGVDAADELAPPARVRTLFKRAVLPNGDYALGEYDFARHRDALASLSDPAWSAWRDYAADPGQRLVTFADLAPRDEQGRRISYLFAVQVMDRAGAVSLARDYGRDAVLFCIDEGNAPLLWLAGEPLRHYEWAGEDGTVSLTVAPGQPLSLQWIGTAHGNYESEVVAYRHGWDVADLDDDNDPGWALPAGDSPAHRQAPSRAFDAGVHSLTVRCWDLAGAMTQVVVVFDVVPVPDRADQRPLLLVDDVIDQASNAWPVGNIPCDRDGVRDAFWVEALADVEGFNPEVDSFDCEMSHELDFGDLVRYRAVIWTGKGSGGFIRERFEPNHGRTYVWLEAYQQHIGNLLLVGQSVLRPFAGDFGCELAGFDPWSTYAAPLAMPLSFSHEGLCSGWLCPGSASQFAAHFGEAPRPDGSRYWVGPALFPTSSLGVDALDLTAHGGPYARHCPPFVGRRSQCDGLKALTLDQQFQADWPGAADLPETVLTWRLLEPRDYPAPPAYPDLAGPAQWSMDEFYDGNVVDPAQRPVVPRLLPDGRAAVAPMLRVHSRFDWIDALHAARGDPDWPENAYTQDQLRQICGEIGLTADGRHASVEGQTTGFLSRVHEATKPGGRPDVCWGFDPSRFDRGPMQQVIRWVVHEAFGLPRRP